MPSHPNKAILANKPLFNGFRLARHAFLTKFDAGETPLDPFHRQIFTAGTGKKYPARGILFSEERMSDLVIPHRPMRT